MNAGQRGPWVEAVHPTGCRMCGAVYEPGSLVRYDPEVPGLVCAVCGQPEPDEDGQPGSQPGPDDQSGLLGQIRGGH
jgi:hypothetical protein